jgi:hypothetical protein
MSTDQVTETDATAQVEALAHELSRRGFATTVTTGDGRRHPCVRVVNRDAAHMQEDVYAAPGTDGQWSFWWSWADKIGPIDDIETAAAAISYVLDPGAGAPVPA